MRTTYVFLTTKISFIYKNYYCKLTTLELNMTAFKADLSQDIATVLLFSVCLKLRTIWHALNMTVFKVDLAQEIDIYYLTTCLKLRAMT